MRYSIGSTSCLAGVLVICAQFVGCSAETSSTNEPQGSSSDTKAQAAPDGSGSTSPFSDGDGTNDTARATKGDFATSGEGATPFSDGDGDYQDTEHGVGK